MPDHAVLTVQKDYLHLVLHGHHKHGIRLGMLCKVLGTEVQTEVAHDVAQAPYRANSNSNSACGS